METGLKFIADISQAQALFDNLDINKQKNIIRAAIRNAMAPVLSGARSNFKTDFENRTGKAFDSLGLQMYRRGLGAAVGARLSGGHRGFYAKFLDIGTKQRFKKSGATTGKIHPSLFFNENAAAKMGKATEDLADSVIFILNKQIKAGKI